MYRYFKSVSGAGSGNCIYFWKSKGLSMKILHLLLHMIIAFIQNFDTKTRAEFNGSCLKEDKNIYTHGKIVNI